MTDHERLMYQILGRITDADSDNAPPKDTFYARVTEDGRKQTLQAHTENTSRLAHDFAEDFGAGKLSETIALYHDVGKARLSFQNYLFAKEKRGKVLHSIYGAAGPGV